MAHALVQLGLVVLGVSGVEDRRWEREGECPFAKIVESTAATAGSHRHIFFSLSLTMLLRARCSPALTVARLGPVTGARRPVALASARPAPLASVSRLEAAFTGELCGAAVGGR